MQHADDFARVLSNTASNVPLTRLRAVHELGEQIRATVDAWVEQAIQEQVTAARGREASWREVGDALGITGQQAGRRFGRSPELS